MYLEEPSYKDIGKIGTDATGMKFLVVWGPEEGFRLAILVGRDKLDESNPSIRPGLICHYTWATLPIT